MAFSDEGYGPNDGPGDDSTSFSSSGPADISNPRGGGRQVEMPTFFDRSYKVDFGAENTGMDSYETLREQAIAEDTTGPAQDSRSRSARIS